MFRRSRFSVRPNVSTTGRTAATPQEAPSANQEAAENPRDISESIDGTAVTDKSVVTPAEKSTGPGECGDQNGEGTSSSAAVQRRKRFSVKPKVAPGRPATLARTVKSPVKASSETPVEVSGSDVDKPATSSHTSPTAAPQGLQSSKRRKTSEDIKQSKVQPKLTPISSDSSAASTIPPSEDSLVQSHLPADSGKHQASTSGSQVKEVPPRPPDRVPPIIPDKEAIELSEKAKSLVSSKSGLSLSPSALSLSRLLNDPSDLQRLAKAQKLRQLLREERHKEKKLKKAKTQPKEYTIDPAKMTMRDLIRYLPMSNPMTSSLEHSNEENETVIPASPEREESPERAQEPEGLPKIGSPREEENEEAEEEQDEALMVPQVKVAEDGSLIIDEESLTVEVQRAKGPNPAQDRDPIFERGSTTTYSSFRTSTCPKPWSSEETDMFFLAISMVGTDFSMICQLFPHRARAEIKSKFKREERGNSWRIDKAFRERRRLDIEYFSKLLEKILEFQKNRKKLKSLAEKNSPKKRKKKKATGKKAARRLSDVEEEDEEDENELPDLDEEEGEKENEDLCSEGGTSASKPKRQRKRKTRQDAPNEEPNNKKNKMDEKSSEQGEASIPEDTEAAPEDPTNSDMSEKTENVTAAKDTAVKPAKLSCGRAPKPLPPLGRKCDKKVPPPTTTAKDSGDQSVNDEASKEQENKDGSPLGEASKKISTNDEISSEEEEAVVQPPRPTRYGRVPKPTKLLSYPCKEDAKCSESDATPTSPEGNTASATKPKTKCKAKRGRGSKPQLDQESKKPKLVTLRASQSDYSDEENEEQWEQEEVVEEQDPACSSSNDSTHPAFVPSSLRSPSPIISVVEETMEELDILANMPDVLSISQDALSPDASCEHAQNEMGTAEPCEHQLDLLVDVIEFLSSEHTEVSEDESYNEAAQTLLTISNLTPHSHLTQSQMATQYHITETISNIEESQHLEGEIPSNPAAHEQSASPCTSAVFGDGVTETSKVVATVELQNLTVESGDMPVVKTNDQISTEQRSGFDMNHTPQLQSSPESSNKISPPTRISNLSVVKPKLDLGQPSSTAQPKSQPETSTVSKLVPKEATPTIPECTPALLKDDIFCAEVGLTEEPSGSQDRSLTKIDSGPLTYQNVSENQSHCVSDAHFVPSLEHATQETESSSVSRDGKHITCADKKESGSTDLVTSDISVTEPQVEHGSNADSVLAQEDSQNSAAVEDLPVSQEPDSNVASACQSRRSRLQKVKPKPNLQQTSRTARPKPQIMKNATETDSSPTQISKFNKKAIAVVEPEQTCTTPPVKPNQNTGPAPDLMPPLDLECTVTPTEELSKDIGRFGLVDSGAATSGQSASENLNFSEDQFKSNREQARTRKGSISESTDEKLISEIIASGSNPATSEILVTEPQVEQWSSTDSAPVEENSSHSAGLVTPVEDLPVSQETESKAASSCQPRRSRLPKVKPKPNLPQASRIARSKAQVTEDSKKNDSSSAPIPKFQEKSIAEEEPKQTSVTPPEKPTQSTVPASHLKPSLHLGFSLTPTEESSTTEEKNIDVGLFGQEDSGATTSDQSASKRQKFSEVQFQPSKEQTRGVTTSESIECSYINLMSSDSAVKESEVGQGSNKDSAKEDSDHSAAYVTPVAELAASQKIEDEAACTFQSRRSELQEVESKPNLPQTVRSTSSDLQTTEDPVTQKPPNLPSQPESSDNPISEVEAQPACTTNFAETSSLSVLSLELCTDGQELSSPAVQNTDVGVGPHSSSESSEPNVPQRRRRFSKVKPKPNLLSSIRTTRSKLQPKDIKPEKHQMDTPVDKNSAQTKLEPTEHDSETMTSIHCSLNTELLSSTKSAFSESEMSLDSTNDMGASSDTTVAISGVAENQSMLTDSNSENKSDEKFAEDKISDKVEDAPASQGDCKLDVPARLTDVNTQPTDDPTAISDVHSSEDGSTESKIYSVLTTNAYPIPDPKESSHQSCPESDSEEKSQDAAQQCSEISENNQTSNNQSQSANRTDESQSESADCSTSLRKASSTRRGRLKPRPNLGPSTQPPQPQQVQSTTQAEAESCSHIVDTSVSHKLVSELRQEVQEPVEGAVKQHNSQDSSSNDAGSSLSCLTEVTFIQNTSTSSLEGTQNHPGLTMFPDMLSQQVPSDPDEPFFILSLTEIPVCSSGEVVDRAVEPLSYLPLTDASIQQQSSVPGESLAAAGDGSRSDVPVPRSAEESGEMSLINVKDVGPDSTTHIGLIVKDPMDANEGSTVQSPKFSENVDNNDDIESTPTKQKLTGTRRRAKLQANRSSARKTRGSKTLTTDTTQDLHHHGPSVQPEVSDATAKASDKLVTGRQKASGDQVDITEETPTCKKDGCSGAPTQSTNTRVTSSCSRKPEDFPSFLAEKKSTAASTDPPPSKAVSKSSKVRTSRAAGKQPSTTLHDVAATPSRTQSPHAAHSASSTTSPTQTQVDVKQTPEYSRQCSDPVPSTSQCTAEVSAFQQSDYVESDSVEEPTSISQYFLSDIFTEIEEG